MGGKKEQKYFAGWHLFSSPNTQTRDQWQFQRHTWLDFLQKLRVLQIAGEDSEVCKHHTAHDVSLLN